MREFIHKWSLKLREIGKTPAILLSLAFILSMANVDAVISKLLHPEIPYFDHEHIIVGTIAAFFSALFLGGVYQYSQSVEERLRERERSEIALQAAVERALEEKSRSEAIISAIGDGISIQDRNFKILYQNQAHKELIGDHEGEYCYRAYQHREQVCEQCPVASSFLDDSIHTVERTVRIGQDTKYVEITASPLKTRGGTIIAGIEAVRDVTERKRTEESIRENEERYKRLSQEFDGLLNAIPDSLTLQSQDLSIRWANRGAAVGMKRDLPEIIGKHCYELWHNRTAPCDPCPVVRSFTSGREENDTVETPDGRIWDLRTFPIKDDGETVTRVIELARDITRHRRLERQLMQAQKMETVGLLAGGIAHDFNNILTAVLGYGNLVYRKMPAEDPLRIYIEQVLTASRRAAELTRGLLAFSRQQVIAPLTTDINQIIRRIGKLLNRIIGEDVELVLSLTANPAAVVVDPGRIEQVFMNLATNARDAMQDGGRLTIETDIAEIDDAYIAAHGFGKPGTYVRVTVTDTGSGIDNEAREQIFEPFFTTKEVGKGTGLGLSIVYGTVKQHNGYVNCYSEPGRGTSFRIYLPAGRETAESASVAPEETHPRGSETVLLAEDDEAVRKLAKVVLEESGYTVIEAVDGEDAAEKLRVNKDRVELVILDVIMPKRTGLDVYREALALRQDIKALFTSGYAADLVQTKGVLDRGLHFISKPIAPQDLLKAVRKALSSGV